MKRRALAAAALVTAAGGAFATLSIGEPLARAAGLSRPNVVGARAIGLGGAFTAVADDPTAVWYNPSGIALSADNVVYIGGEIVFTQRSYTPGDNTAIGGAQRAADGHTHAITENTSPTVIPVIGASTRFGFGKSAPTRFAFAIGAYDAYGGSISYKPSDFTHDGTLDGLSKTQILDYELVPTLAYQVTDVLSVGAGLRIGINTFNVTTNDPTKRVFATLNGSGVGIGANLGVMLKPHRMVQIGAVYRTPLSVALSGSGDVTISDNTKPQDFGLHVTWPQSAGLGVSVTPHPRILASAQVDWTGWSSVQSLDLTLGGAPQPKAMRYQDTYAIHVGVQGAVTRFMLLRLGWSWDSNAIPDLTLRRENIDSDKSTLAFGLGFHFWKIFLDAAFETLLPIGSRTVTTPFASTMYGAENEPGRYDAHVYSAELSAQVRF